MRRLSALLLIITSCEPAPPQTFLPVTDGPHQPELLAVEPGEARVWVTHRSGDTHLTAIDVDTGKSKHVLDLTAARDPRLVFPAPGRALLVVARDGTNTLVPIDTTRLVAAQGKTFPSQLWELSLSRSGRHLAALNYLVPGLPTLEVIDTTSIEKTTLPHQPLEVKVAAWAYASETLITANFDEASEPILDFQRFVAPFATPDLTIKGFALEEVNSASLSQWRPPIVSSPDDRWAAAMGLSGSAFNYVVLFDQATATRRELPDVAGPVVFSRDSRTAVATRFTDAGTPLVVAIPLDGGDPREVTLPVGGAPSTQVLIDDSGHHLVMATSSSSERALVVYDIASGSVAKVERMGVGTIESYAFEPDGSALWLVDSGYLYRLDLATQALDKITWYVDAIALLPAKRLLAAAASGDGVVMFFDLGTRQLVRKAQLAPPDETSAPALTF